MRRICLVLLFNLLAGSSCCSRQGDDPLKEFATPPAEARSYVRWWWNGNRISKAEISHQLDVLHSAGIGVVEINPIAILPRGDTNGKRFIVGSGWPLGGEFLKKAKQSIG